MRRIIDFLLGRRRGTKLILSALGSFDKVLVEIETGLRHIDQEIAERTTTIEQEQAAILSLNQLASRGAVAHSKISALIGGQH